MSSINKLGGLTEGLELLLVDGVAVERENDRVGHDKQDDRSAEHGVRTYFVEHHVHLVGESALRELFLSVHRLVVQLDLVVEHVVRLIVLRQVRLGVLLRVLHDGHYRRLRVQPPVLF